MSKTTAGFEKVRSEASNGVKGTEEYEAMVKELREEFAQGRTRTKAWRREQLLQVCRMLEENHERITAAVLQSHGGPKARGLADLGAHGAAEAALAELDAWTADEVVQMPVITCPTRRGRAYVRREPKGVVLIISPWNYPFELCFGPLVSAIAAGNCAVIKPSEVSPGCAALIEELVAKYLDRRCFRVVQGAVPETTALLKVQWDHIFYTGNGAVGRVVMRAAAEHLTPLTLELGGKSPCIIDKTARLDVVVNRLMVGKFLNVGQTCIAPDYVIVHKSKKAELLERLRLAILSQFSERPDTVGDYGRVINSRHVERIAGLLKASKGRVVTGGADKVNSSACYVPPTVVEVTDPSDSLLSEEIFGPVLPVVEVDDTLDALPFLQKVCPKPLALYIFAENNALTKTILDRTQSGGVAINTCVEQFGNHHLPFGGIGESGFGCCHGKHGFEEFSHKRAVLKQDSLLKRDGFLPPFPIPDFFYDLAIRAAVTGFIPRPLRSASRLLLRSLMLVLLAWSTKKLLSHTP